MKKLIIILLMLAVLSTAVFAGLNSYAEITPKNPTTNDDLVCELVITDDSGNILGREHEGLGFMWTIVPKVGEIFTESSSYILNHVWTNPGDKIRCDIIGLGGDVFPLKWTEVQVQDETPPPTEEVEPLQVLITEPRDGDMFSAEKPIHFIAKVEGGLDEKNYFWDFGDGFTSAEAKPTHVYIKSGDYEPSLEVTSGKQKVKDSVTIKVYERGYEIKDMQTYTGIDLPIPMAGFKIGKVNVPFYKPESIFYRGVPLYLKFNVYDLKTKEPVDDLEIAKVYMYNAETGEGRIDLQAFNGLAGTRYINNGQVVTINNVLNLAPSGEYYYYLPRIPLSDESLGENFVFAFVLKSNKADHQEITVYIKNNPVQMKDIPDATLKVGESITLDLDNYAFDVEDKDLYWYVYTENKNIVETDFASADKTNFAQIDKLKITAKSVGVEEISFIVRDTDASVRFQKVKFNVVDTRTNYPPTACIRADKTTINEGESVSFSGTCSADSDGQIVKYSWDFDDGSSLDSNSFIEHVFSNEGVYNVELTVTDDRGAIDSEVIKIKVTKEEPPVKNPASSEKNLRYRNEVTHDFRINEIRPLSGKLAYKPGEIVSLMVELENLGVSKEEVEMELSAFDRKISQMLPLQYLGTNENSMINAVFKIPQDAKSGEYFVRITADNLDNTHSDVGYWSFRIVA